MNKIIKYQPSIRKKIIDMLMFTLYPDARTIYREYVQNALDSINAAVRKGILSNIKDGVVNIDINTNDNYIIIRDNGTGINKENAPSRLLDISASTKDGIKEAGQFGIGRLVGGGFCHKLIFTTSSKNENIATQVTFDVDKIWKMVKEDEDDYLANDVIDQCTEIIHIEEQIEKHYFEVQLQDIKKEQASTLLNKDSVIEYLNIVAPTEFKPEFKNSIVYKSTQHLPEFEILNNELDKVQIFVGNQKIEKQYALQINGNNDKIFKLEYFKIENPNFGFLAWGWFALTKYSTQINPNDQLSCMRLRSHNIQVGSKDLLSSYRFCPEKREPLWKETRGNSYFYGEIYTIHPNLRPTADRENLVSNKEKEALYDGLKNYFKKLTGIYTKANQAKIAIRKIREGAIRIENNNSIDRISIDEINNKGIAVYEKLVKNATFEPLLNMLALYKDDYLAAKYRAEQIQNNLQKNIVTTNISTRSQINTTNVIDKAIKPQANTQLNRNINPQESEIKKPLIDNKAQSESNDSLNKPNKDTSINNEKQTISNPLKKNEILTPLNNIMDENEIWILRRVFHILNTYCPNTEHDRKTIDLLMQEIVKEFKNE